MRARLLGLRAAGRLDGASPKPGLQGQAQRSVWGPGVAQGGCSVQLPALAPAVAPRPLPLVYRNLAVQGGRRRQEPPPTSTRPATPPHV